MIEISETRSVFFAPAKGLVRTVIVRRFEDMQIDVMVKRAKRWLRNKSATGSPPRHIDMAIAVFQKAYPKDFTQYVGEDQ